MVGGGGHEPDDVSSDSANTLQIADAETGTESGTIPPDLARLAASLRKLSQADRAALARLLNQ